MPDCYTGTRPKSGAPAYITVNRNAIQDSLGSGVLAWLLRGAIPDQQVLIKTSDYCAALPADPGAFDPDWLTSASGMILAQTWVLNWWKANQWNTYCE